MSTMIVKGAGTQFKVTSKTGKKPNVLLVTSNGNKRINVTKDTKIKFAA